MREIIVCDRYRNKIQIWALLFRILFFKLQKVSKLGEEKFSSNLKYPPPPPPKKNSKENLKGCEWVWIHTFAFLTLGWLFSFPFSCNSLQRCFNKRGGTHINASGGLRVGSCIRGKARACKRGKITT